MEANLLRKNMWNGAAVAGLALGGVSSVYLFATQLMAGIGIPAFLNMILTGILWIAKFGGCIWLMMFFMKRFADGNKGVENRDTRRFGTITALLSALVYSTVCFANVAFISADMFAEQTNILIQQMGGMMDSNTMSMMEIYMDNLPQVTFFSNLIYCFIFGAILSSILSKNIPSTDPFADYKPEDQ